MDHNRNIEGKMLPLTREIIDSQVRWRLDLIEIEFASKYRKNPIFKVFVQVSERVEQISKNFFNINNKM
jgi:hypothetical protein